jgi:hypothetical protein
MPPRLLKPTKISIPIYSPNYTQKEYDPILSHLFNDVKKVISNAEKINVIIFSHNDPYLMCDLINILIGPNSFFKFLPSTKLNIDGLANLIGFYDNNDLMIPANIKGFKYLLVNGDISGDWNKYSKSFTYNTVYGIHKFSLITVPGDMVNIIIPMKENLSNQSVLLTRPDIFPPFDSIGQKVPTYKVYFTEVGTFSATPLIVSRMMVGKFPQNNNPIVLFDGTASTGADVINILYVMLGKPLRIVANELDPLNYNALINNIKLYKFDSLVTTYNTDTIYLLEEPILQNINIMYFDPPWGGREYKNNQYIDLSLGGIDIFDLVKKLAKDIYKYPLLYSIIVKAPFNYNKSQESLIELSRANAITLERFDVPGARNIVYLFVDVNAYRKTVQKDIRCDNIEDYIIDKLILLNQEIPIKNFTEDANSVHKYIMFPITSGLPSWINVLFAAKTYPTIISIGSLKIKDVGYTRIYISIEKRQYQSDIEKIYKWLWHNNHYANLSYLTLYALNEARANIIIVDLKDPKIVSNILKLDINLIDIPQCSYYKISKGIYSSKPIQITEIGPELNINFNDWQKSKIVDIYAPKNLKNIIFRKD